MDVAAFEHWLGEIAALNLLQRRQAWQALALSEASDSYDGETGEPLGAGIASVSIGRTPGETVGGNDIVGGAAIEPGWNRFCG